MWKCVECMECGGIITHHGFVFDNDPEQAAVCDDCMSRISRKLKETFSEYTADSFEAMFQPESYPDEAPEDCAADHMTWEEREKFTRNWFAGMQMRGG